MRRKGFTLILVIIIIVLVEIVSVYYYRTKKENVSVNNLERIQDDSITRCLEKIGDKVSIDFENCKQCKDVEYVGFGSTHLELIGMLNGKCQMNWGGEIENPNWDGKLVNHCLIPSNLGKLEFDVSNYGVNFSSINKYCELIK